MEGESGITSKLQSSPKRPRGNATPRKVLPTDYSLCDPKDLAVLISDMLMELIRFNDDIPLKDGALTRFHSRFGFPRRSLATPSILTILQSSTIHFRP